MYPNKTYVLGPLKKDISWIIIFKIRNFRYVWDNVN